VDASDDIGTKGAVNGAVARKAGFVRKLWRIYDQPPMAFARSVITSVTRVLMAFIDHFEPLWGKPFGNCRFYFVFKAHYFAPPLFNPEKRGLL
jgi:hypothetical protein